MCLFREDSEVIIRQDVMRGCPSKKYSLPALVSIVTK
jgi:hypothetical protein